MVDEEPPRALTCSPGFIPIANGDFRGYPDLSEEVTDAWKTVHRRADCLDPERIVGSTKTDDLCRRHGICQNTYYRWKAKYADMEVSDVRRLKDLETENGKLKRIVAEQMLDIQALKVALGKKY